MLRSKNNRKSPRRCYQPPNKLSFLMFQFKLYTLYFITTVGALNSLFSINTASGLPDPCTLVYSIYVNNFNTISGYCLFPATIFYHLYHNLPRSFFSVWKIPLTPATPTMYLKVMWEKNKTHTSSPPPPISLNLGICTTLQMTNQLDTWLIACYWRVEVWDPVSSCHIEEGQRQKQMQRSSFLFGLKNLFNSWPR